MAPPPAGTRPGGRRRVTGIGSATRQASVRDRTPRREGAALDRPQVRGTCPASCSARRSREARGTASSRPRVYGWGGVRRARPGSRSRPPGRRTAPRRGRRSPCTTPRSWVISRTLKPSDCWSRRISSRICRGDRDVERRRRLVEDQQLRLAQQGHRDHRALQHPAGELVRVGVDHASGVGKTDRRAAAR